MWAEPDRSVLIEPHGDITLELAEADGSEWLAEGPGGEGLGPLEEVIATAAHPDADPAWITAAGAALRRELQVKERRQWLLVLQRDERMYHATRSVTRPSIEVHGLDWQLMFTAGIAGNLVPEWPGNFLCANLESAQWFARMGRGEQVDIWEVDVTGIWLEGDPGADLGGGDSWMIAPVPIPRRRLRLIAKDLTPSYD